MLVFDFFALFNAKLQVTPLRALAAKANFTNLKLHADNGADWHSFLAKKKKNLLKKLSAEYKNRKLEIILKSFLVLAHSSV